MLVDNKFYYISLPRCGSVSFVHACVESNLNIKYFSQESNDDLNIVYDKMSKGEEIPIILFRHSHEEINLLQEKYGYNLKIIAVKRDRHERFISHWKQVVKMCAQIGDFHSEKKLKDLGEDDILFYNLNDFGVNFDNANSICHEFIKKHNLSYTNEYLYKFLRILYIPMSHYHRFYKDIIWFDFKDLSKMEEWVSKETNTNFKLNKKNTSTQIETKLNLNDNFIRKYNQIYDDYDKPKSVKTFI